MRRGERRAERLRRVVDRLPERTCRAMLEAVEHERIVVGAYVHDGGVCPMLAAHRRGGRTDLASFARAWDRYTRARRPRPATERELRTLRAMLEARLATAVPSPPPGGLGQAIRDHQRALRARFEREARADAGSWTFLARERAPSSAGDSAAGDREAEPVAAD